MKKLPIYKLDVTEQKDDTGVDFVAIVDKPAIKRSYQTFNEAPPVKFTITSEERQIISGPLMLADTPIYRMDAVRGEHYVVFSKEAIERIVQKFFREGNQRNANEMHDPNRQLEGMTLYESFISDSQRGVAPMQGYEDAPEGSWFGSYKVESPEVWKGIKESGFTGFSVEGFFNYGEPEVTEDTLYAEVDAMLKLLGF